MLLFSVAAGLLACLRRTAFPHAYGGVQWLVERLTC